MRNKRKIEKPVTPRPVLSNTEILTEAAKAIPALRGNGEEKKSEKETKKSNE